MPSTPLPRFCLVVPAKQSARAKSRLAPLGDQVRRSLASAFLIDTVTAALDSPLVGAVLVMTEDRSFADRLRARGVETVADGTVDDLNASLVQAAAEGRRRWPDLAPAALCADLPALRAAELTAALEVATRHPAAFVSDTESTGTTLFTATAPHAFTPRFGVGSCEAHRAAGAHEIVEVVAPTLRRDVDTPTDLDRAVRLGVGVHTAQVVSGTRLADMQATVSTFDPETFRGTVLLDDGVEVAFSEKALADSEIRLLRPGQRVRLDTSGDGGDLAIEHLQIITLG